MGSGTYTNFPRHGIMQPGGCQSVLHQGVREWLVLLRRKGKRKPSVRVARQRAGVDVKGTANYKYVYLLSVIKIAKWHCFRKAFFQQQGNSEKLSFAFFFLT